MTDVTRALLLPDVYRPSLPILKNLAIYWDEIVYPAYEEEIEFEDELLIKEGVVRLMPRQLDSGEIFPAFEHAEKKEGERVKVFMVRRDSKGEPQEVVTGEMTPEEVAARERSFSRLADLEDHDVEALGAIFAGFQEGQVNDALSVAAHLNLAPVSHSIGGHLAAVLGSPDVAEDLPVKEAALLTTALQGFAVESDVSTEEVLQFREATQTERARFRASLTDLATQLKGSQDPLTLLSQARDTYRNRVEPALGALEEVLKENKIKFFLKSLMGASAITFAPVEPLSTTAGAARLMSQTIDYSYSKSKLVREHPFGYLHQVGEQFSSSSQGDLGALEEAVRDPRRTLRNMWSNRVKQGREWDRSRLEG